MCTVDRPKRKKKNKKTYFNRLFNLYIWYIYIYDVVALEEGCDIIPVVSKINNIFTVFANKNRMWQRSQEVVTLIFKTVYSIRFCAALCVEKLQYKLNQCRQGTNECKTHSVFGLLPSSSGKQAPCLNWQQHVSSSYATAQ